MHPTVFRVDRPAAPLPTNIQNDHDLTRWREEHAAAQTAASRLATDRTRMLASASVESITKKDAEIGAARIRVERAAAVIEAAERKISDAAAREAAKEPERLRRYAAGKKAAAEAERLMRDEYGPMAGKVAAIMRRLAELRAIVSLANADLPATGEQLNPDAFRGRPAEASRYEMRPHVVTVEEDGTVVHSVIRAESDRDRGGDRDDGGPAMHVSGHGAGLRQEIRQRQVYIAGSAGIDVPPLDKSVTLPGLAWDDAPFWPPAAR
ncbi:hypothetical protein [Methylobacterium gnaphalii]|uniref:Uncharacterized protein n=1 Tax=Methylobacterium gnaphalii TaxID=1010610 RepID=A0A512JF54_9HYPH|nr:hypothetical protein [Methylobacterium gnaphalii]GEP08581.1 hypothetical protein MGN01_04260 [Methylobacterium gnaphalii]GJD70584.1 hypothetical protein MMMDOFMJ_3533 [Methylobacterium gnaphalii]GLS50798.1 hypothetical protein GCM10007885_36520 [Methylobacterium gnaphalii]